MRGVVANEAGGADALEVVEVDDPVPGPGDLLVSVAATAVNRADLLQRRGMYPPPEGASEILGLEVAGEVVAVGPDVSGWSAGDQVCAILAGGGYAELAVVPASTALPVPAGMDLTSAAAIPEVFLTAYDNMILRGRLEPGETVLIHGGSGGVGTAAIQLAKRHGCHVLTTAGSGDKLDRCLALGADGAFDYHDEDFVEATRDHTAGRGADVVLDVMGAAYLDRNLQALATEGRLVVIGLQGGVIADLNLGMVMGKRLTLCGSTLRARGVEEKAALVAKAITEVWPGFADGSLTPVVDRVLDGLESAIEAHLVLEAGDRFGKIVLRVR